MTPTTPRENLHLAEWSDVFREPVSQWRLETVQRTHSLSVNLANGKDALLIEPLDSDSQAKFVEKSLWRALRGT